MDQVVIRRDAPSSSLLSQQTWLMDANSWSFASDGSSEETLDMGRWPIGNGRVFAMAGAAPPCNRLSAITGPHYGPGRAHAAGWFGDCWLGLKTERGDVSLPHQAIWRPRESGVLITLAHDRTVSLLTVDFAPPGMAIILRIVEVWRGDRLGADGRLIVQLPLGEMHDSRRRSLRVETPDGGVLILSALAAGRRAYPGRVDMPLTDVPAIGGVQRAVLLLATGSDRQAALSGLPQLLHPLTLLEQTRSFWRVWLAHTYTPDLWPQNFPGPTSTSRSLLDLLEMGKLGLKMQTSEPNGALGNMETGSGLRVRDASGPLRALLAMGCRDEARDVLEFQYRGALALGRVADSADWDLDVPGVADRSDWSGTPPPPFETAAHLILQRYWWLQAGGDAELVRRHWPLLQRCAVPPRHTVEGLPVPEEGDGYPYRGLSDLFPERCGWPNGLVAESESFRPWRLDAHAAYARAQWAMAHMAERLGDVEAAPDYLAEAERTESAVRRWYWQEARGWYAPAIYPLGRGVHPSPFAPINLSPLWLGHDGPDDAQARRNLAAVVDLVGFRGSTPDCEYTIGTVPGYLLWNLTLVGADLAPLALANLVALASPAGEWSALHGPEGRAGAGRMRPIETGVNVEAVYGYFTRRGPGQEPTHDLRGVLRAGRTLGPGPVQSFRYGDPGVTGRAVLIAAEPAEVAWAARAAGLQREEELTVIEPGLPFGPDFIQRLLFEPGTGARRTDACLLGASALAGDRRSMKPPAFWRHPEVVQALERFQQAGGRLIRPA